MPRNLLSQAVNCPTCKAKPGERCKIPSTEIPTDTHQKRRVLWFDGEIDRLRTARRTP